MQTIVHVICSKGPSLRESIVKDQKLEEFGLAVSQRLNPNRKNGWAKIHSTLPDHRGALNLKWNADARTLLCRVVNKGKGRPEQVLGDFVAYLLHRQLKRITAVNIVPPK
jgi:hypothetical protein